jgi:hypothetical protein
MILYSTTDGTGNPIWALAGTSPGTNANWIETTNPTISDGFKDATGQTAPVPLDYATTWAGYKADYLAPVMTDTVAEIP